jgi:hypothetical protein
MEILHVLLLLSEATEFTEHTAGTTITTNRLVCFFN